MFPPGPSDPWGIHGAIWEELGYERFEPPVDNPLALVAYLAVEFPTAYVEPINVGSTLPEMPLFLAKEWYINVPLESTYQTAFRGLPAHWRGVIERAS